MIRNVIIGLLAVAVIATGYWGFQEQQQSQILTVQAENGYQRAFHELAYHIDQIEDQLGATMAMNTRRQLTPSLAEVWRLTSLASEEIGQLPLGIVDLSKTEEFLHHLGTFSYKTSIRDLDKEPLTDEEYEKLEKFHDYSKTIKNDLRKTQAMTLKKDMRWLDLNKEFQAQDEPLDNAIVDGFRTMDEHVKGASEVEWGPGMVIRNDHEKKLEKRLEKRKITEEEAKEIALSYVDMEQATDVIVSDTGDGLDMYSVIIDDPERQAHYYLDMTQQGGHPIWFLQERQINEQNMSLNEASNKAQEFLEEHDKENMQLVDSKQYDSIGVFEFVYLEDNVRVYPDTIKVEVALDEGDIIGYEAMSYLVNHHDRDLEEPELTADEARERLNPRLEVMEDHIALIQNDLGEEVLCYEFFGVINDETYRIYINAEDGEEEKVEKMQEAEPVYDFD